MALEQFKKQVLILHSEQSALDSLSAGFNERYTVHCATSGSEALTTLGETQIDVMVSAQRLPGMSGLDALREAKKRSPDTIGILLAGSDDEGIEALVGDQEVFQVVRGSITPDALKSLVDGATQQARLMALAESANDMAANPDEPASEHIVMETSENGSAIISDGTGRFAALDPNSVSAAADVGGRAVDVLVLTQDEEFLGTVRESARGLHNVIYANTLQQADEALRQHKVGVAVVDAAMVGSNVEKLTLHLRNAVPRLVAIVAGRRDDGEMLMDLINRGKVYRFLLKPVSPGRARLAIEASVKHHLEAPDSAFVRAGGTAAPKAAPKPPKDQPKPQPGPAARPQPVARPAPPTKSPPSARSQPQPGPKAGKDKSGAAPAKAADAGERMTARRDDALTPANDDKSFTDTMTGIVDAVRKPFTSHAEPTAAKAVPPEDSGGPTFGKLKLLGIGAAAAVVLASSAFWYFSTPDAPEPVAEPAASTPSISEADIVVDPEPVPETASPVDELLEQARLAADAGQVYDPPGSNAIELYLAAMAAAPDDAAVETEFAEMIVRALTMAESALLDRRTADANAALDRVAMADPDNARLPFLAAQLSQLQLREYVDGARVAIREGRYEDARTSLDAARNLPVSDASEIDIVADELQAALSAQQVDELLGKAAARLEEGKLTAPSNDNARYYYELALSNDPGNAVARQGLVTVASKLVLHAREEIDADNLALAEDLIADARRLDPASSEVAASISALQAARDRREQDRIAAEQRAREEQEAAERAAADRAAAERAAAERAAAERAAAERAAAQRAAAERVAVDTTATERAAAETAATETAEPAQPPAATAARVDDPTEQQVVAQTQPAEGAAAAPATEDVSSPSPVLDTQPVAVSSLKRTKYVAPKYPRSAQRRGVSGWVDVVFTVDIDGTVSDIEIRDSNPDDMFDSSATKAVEGWEFEPIVEDGVAVRKRAAVRMMFAIE